MKTALLTVVTVFLTSAVAFGQVDFDLAAAGQGPEPEEVDDGWDGDAIRITYDGEGNQSNGVAWPNVVTGDYETLRFDFELRFWNEDFAGDADGVGFAYANVDEVLEDVPVWPTGEEPNFAGSLGVGFDTWMNSSLDGGLFADGTLPNSISLHYDGQAIETLTMDEFGVEDDWLQNQAPKRAAVIVQPTDTGADVTVTIEDLDSGDVITAYDAEPISGFQPYDGQVVFRGRTGGENSNQDVDNVSLTHTPPGGSPTTTLLYGRHVGPGVGGETVVITEGVDTFVAQSAQNGPDGTHGDLPEIEFDGEDGGGENHALIMFDIPDGVLAGFGQGTATLTMQVTNEGDSGMLHRMTSDWLSGADGGDSVTWNNIPNGPGVVAGGNAAADSNAETGAGTAGQAVTIDVSADVQAWAGGEPNYGWGILPTGNNGYGIASFENATGPIPSLTLVSAGGKFLQAGDANQDFEFNQVDLVQVQISGLYLSGNPATWGQGDWNGAPGGQQGSPPPGDGLFNQVDIIAALNAGIYLTGPYALAPDDGTEGDEQTSIVYNPATGEVKVDAPASTELTSINIDSAASVFTGDAAMNLGGSFDNDADNNIFKATFGSSFGSLTFGNVAQAGLSKDFVMNDLTVIGSLSGGGDLGAVDLVYVPEPSTAVLLIFGLVAVFLRVRQQST